MDWLLGMRKKQRLSQCEVAGAAGISQSYYAAIENAVRKPSVETAMKISKVLGFSWTRFFDSSIEDSDAPKTAAEEIA